MLKFQQTKKTTINKKAFREKFEFLIKVDEKKEKGEPITNQDSLTRFIMEKELGFQFNSGKQSSSLDQTND